MYECKQCGNKVYFAEINNIKTLIILDEKTGKTISCQDKFLECQEVCCEICKSSSADGLIKIIEGI